MRSGDKLFRVAQRAHELMFKILYYIVNLFMCFKCTVICTVKNQSACVWSWILVLKKAYNT